MYEDQTFDVILQRMLSRVPETMDKRESSPIYAALAPAAVELTSMYIAFDCMRKLNGYQKMVRLEKFRLQVSRIEKRN